MELLADMGLRADMESAPTVSGVVQAFKRYSTIEYIKMVKQGILPSFDKHIWQRSFHDHIIRNEQAYQKIWEYIDTNPLKWELDCFYTPDYK
ncbi:transposase [Sporanaerobium hydrogeniformans]|uniref:transposase n=1 Tax=Sporanaerobium hydrogeniformans TaxID=3072179 RepID=UPI0015D4739C|nr:transposase [Lachnospiraceae bacterium]